MFLRGLRVSRPIRRLGCALLALPFLLPLLAEIIHLFASARAVSHQSMCISNVKRIDLGAWQYSADWDETFPPSSQWAALSAKYVEKASVPSAWHCPESAFPFSYASNQAIGGQAMKTMDDLYATVYQFESDASDWNVAGGKANLPPTARHNGGNTYGFLDGHVKWCNFHGLNQARWQPLLVSEEKQP